MTKKGTTKDRILLPEYSIVMLGIFLIYVKNINYFLIEAYFRKSECISLMGTSVVIKY